MRLPPFNQLRAFEAAARHESFLLAADELNVTPGAISRHVKALEEYLGFDLFIRVHKGVRITPAACDYRDAIRAAFLLMEQSTRNLLDGKREGPLNVWCSRLFMRQWLVPRLNAFHARYPNREVRLLGGRSQPGQELPADTDIAIRYALKAEEHWEEAHFLLKTSLTPVCSPGYLARCGPLTEPRDVLDHTLLFTQVRLGDWELWLRSAGLENVEITKKIVLDGEGLTDLAAIRGLGLAMGRREFLSASIENGSLVTPFQHSVEIPGGFYLTHPRSSQNRPKILEFKEWILGEAMANRVPNIPGISIHETEIV